MTLRTHCAVHLRLVREQKQVDDDAGGVEPERLLDGVLDELAEQGARQLGRVDVGDVGAQHQRGLAWPGMCCRWRRLAEGQLDRVGRRATSV